MTKLSVRYRDEQLAAIHAIKEKSGIGNTSEVVRRLVDLGLNEFDDLPEHIQADLDFEQIKDANQWKRRRHHFRSNVRQDITNALEKTPLEPPEYVWEDVIQARIDEAETVYPTRADEYSGYCLEQFDRYIQEYEQMSGGRYDPADAWDDHVSNVAAHWRRGRQDLGVKYAERLAERGWLPDDKTPEELVHEAQADAGEGDWQESLSADRGVR